jgi:hypothetical protein
MASYLADNNQTQIRAMVKDLLNNGTKNGKTTVSYDFQDIANMMNQAMALNTRGSSGGTYHESYFKPSDIEAIYKGQTWTGRSK